MTSGDTRFAELYERYGRRVYAYCRRRTDVDRVDDAVADTFLTAWKRIEEVPKGDEALPWLYGVAYRVLSHQWRSASRRRRLDKKLTGIGLDFVSAPEEFIVQRHESRQVIEALDALKTTDQEILLLTTWEELSPADIAVALGISNGAVRQRLHEARKNLARQYNRLENKRMNPLAARKGGAW